MRIAILYICTGKYSIFWKDFYASCEKFFFKEQDKHYFVFTDDLDINKKHNTTLIKENCRGFPLDSLFRFDMFLKIENEVKSYDYVFFFNANMLFVEKVSYEIFPNKNFKGLIGVIHPMGFKYRKFPSMYTYERNKKSRAYIKKEKKKYEYFMGGVNGGSTEEYYKMVKECSKNIHHDYKNNIVAIFHDESHMNKYFSENEVHSLSTAYGFQEGAKYPFKPKIIIRDKTKISNFFNKYREERFIGRVLRYLNQIYKAITW
ncbi:glycosyl transferase family 6 [Tenacibaculum adriaticum]|uniref:Glycosyl transferase family 6 n=1 Tax=Tenacibaculum adriaticum TaxID=413713 RepID=A0A5S5DN24_9FLAO|nr:family 6 glucosyltransferase [Tenacibaculum adriaticum]TYP97350.1 glycosyl transferase family 6 [Tenacibaculum adriaticum]